MKILGLSLTLGTIAGIPVKVHWSFSLLLVFAGYVVYSEGLPWVGILWFFGFIAMLFSFVVMHEFGHALTARKYGIYTRDVILSPIGGVARLERLPVKPMHELWIALAGPAVNLVLFVILITLNRILYDSWLPMPGDALWISSWKDLMGYLIIINVMLVVFNMIPAFPMDGGRVLRAILSKLSGDRLKATRIASIIGQLIAVVFIGLGVYFDHFGGIFIGLFVMFTARAEYRQLKAFTKMNRTFVGEVMRRRYTILHPDESLESARNNDREGSFLVQNERGDIIGVLPRISLGTSRAEDNLDDLQVSDRMITQWGYVSEGMNLQAAFEALNEYGWALAPVVDPSNNVVGVIDRKILRDIVNGV